MAYQPQPEVTAEHADAQVRLAKLYAYIQTPTYHNLSLLERDLLLRQAIVMSNLVDILRQRIALFPKVKP